MPTVKQLSRIFSKDDSLNRLQDQLASALNPILREIKGDLSGPLESPTVSALRGRSIANVAPAVGQALVYDGLQWVPGAAGTTFTVTPPLDLTAGVLSIPQADAVTDGYLSAADWVAFDSKVTSVTATSPLASSGGATPDISLTGVVAAANGGTGLSSPGTSGYVLTSTGTAWVSAPVPSTNIDTSIVLLMPGIGSAGSTTFPDTSSYQATLTRAGNTQIVATPSVFGGGAVYFDGNGDYIQTPVNSLYSFRTGDFTVEGWIYPITYGGGGFSTLAGCIFTVLNIAGFISTTGKLVALNENGAVVIATSTGTIPLNAWTFFTFARESGVLKIYINGTLDVSAAFTTDVTNQQIVLGSNDARTATTFLKFNGYMNDIRVSRRARYTTSFTPPTALFPVPVAGWAFPFGPAGGVLAYPGSYYPNPSGLAGIAASPGAENTIKIAQFTTGGASVIRWDAYDNGAFTGNTGSIIGPRSNASGGTAFLFPGGTMLVEGGQGTAALGGSAGGVARLRGGLATGSYRSGAAIVEGGGGSTPAGHAYVTGGYSSTSVLANAGNAYVQGGAASDLYGGDVYVDGGGGRTTAGNVVITGGTPTNTFYNSTGGNSTIRGGGSTGTGNGGDVSVLGGASTSGTKGRAYVGTSNTSAVYVASATTNLYAQNQQIDLVSTPPTTGQFLGYNGTKWLPTSLTSTAALAKFGNTLVVDAVNGNNLTASVNGLPFATPEAAISYINTNSLTGVTVWIMPGTYALSAGITIPNTCSLRGLSTQTTKLTLTGSNPGGTVTMLTMGENSRVEDLTLTLTSTNATTNLVGVNTPGSTSTTSKLRTCVVTVDNSSLAYTTSTNVYGIYDNGTGTLGPSSFSFNFTRGVTINVFSNGGGTKRAVFVDTANDITFRDTNFYVAAPVSSLSAGSYVGVETTNATCSVQFRTCSISGPSTAGSYTGSDILQTTPGTGFIANGIQLGPGVDLVNKTAGGQPFTTYVTPTTIEYGLKANLVNSPHYLWPGVQTAADATEVFYRFQQNSICQGMSIYVRTAPGVGNSITVTVRKSTTNVPGSSTATTITATISGTNTEADHYTSSVDFALGEYLSVEIDGNAGNAAQDLVVELDLF